MRYASWLQYSLAGTSLSFCFFFAAVAGIIITAISTVSTSCFIVFIFSLFF